MSEENPFPKSRLREGLVGGTFIGLLLAVAFAFVVTQEIESKARDKLPLFYVRCQPAAGELHCIVLDGPTYLEEQK